MANRKKKAATLMKHHLNGNGIRWFHCEKKRRAALTGIRGIGGGVNWASGQRGSLPERTGGKVGKRESPAKGEFDFHTPPPHQRYLVVAPL